MDPRCFIDLKFRGDVQNLVAMAPVSVTCLTRFSQSCCPQSQGLWKRISVGFLCSSVMVMSSGWASAVEAVQASPLSDYVVAVFTLTGALGILQFFDELAKRDFLEKTLSRKLCHILSGLVFMLFWPLFSTAPLAKYLAAFALVANGFRMIGLGLGLWKNESLVKAISRGGSRRELLQGPLYYAIAILVATLFFWRDSPIGICAIATLCAGDGFADIVGRKYGKLKLPYNSDKSYIGSVAFFMLASLASTVYIAIFSACGFFTATPGVYITSLAVALAGAIVEGLPLPIDDNFTVPFTAIGVGMLLFPF